MSDDPHQIIERLRELGPDAIRDRLKEINREAKALRSLLRSAIYARSDERAAAASSGGRG
jgi:hypothetical protein